MLFQVAIMKSYMTGGITDISPVINSYTDALLDVFPQVRVEVDADLDCERAHVFMCVDMCIYYRCRPSNLDSARPPRNNGNNQSLLYSDEQRPKDGYGT